MKTLWTPTGQPAWDKTCTKIIDDLKICWSLGGDPIDYTKPLRAEVAAQAGRALAAWEATLNNALDYSTWPDFLRATMNDLRALTGEIQES